MFLARSRRVLWFLGCPNGRCWSEASSIDWKSNIFGPVGQRNLGWSTCWTCHSRSIDVRVGRIRLDHSISGKTETPLVYLRGVELFLGGLYFYWFDVCTWRGFRGLLIGLSHLKNVKCFLLSLPPTTVSFFLPIKSKLPAGIWTVRPVACEYLSRW